MSDEWYTPRKHIDLARRVLGGIDVDPASCELAQRTVQATVFYTAADDGLRREWRGRCWCNPPYSRGLIGRFVDKFIGEHQAGRMTQGLLLVNACSDTAWFHRLSRLYPFCLLKGRVRFYRAAGTANSPAQWPSALFYAGPDGRRFARLFGRLGIIVEPSGVARGALCARCGNVVAAARSDARFCSGKCRQAAYRDRRVTGSGTDSRNGAAP